jgi:hypothetical protein
MTRHQRVTSRRFAGRLLVEISITYYKEFYILKKPPGAPAKKPGDRLTGTGLG